MHNIIQPEVVKNTTIHAFFCQTWFVLILTFYYLSFQVTCRNRRVGKTYSCHLCTKKGFLSKLRLSEHEKRKHPAVVVTSVVNEVDTSVASPTSSSHNQSEVVLQTIASTTNNTTHQPMFDNLSRN